MRRIRILGLLWSLMVLAGLLAGTVLTNTAAAQDVGTRRVALVVGNGGYHSVDRLANPANDAKLIAQTLTAAGFTLVGGGPQIDLDKAHFDKAVQDFGRAIAGADVALFYYSGHGMQVQGVNWLVPVDANPTDAKDLDFQMLDASLVLRQMQDSGTKLNLLILDACRNNPFAVRGIRGTAGGLAEMQAPEGTLISYATQPGNVAFDGQSGNSPYSAALAAAIKQPGQDVFRVFNQVGLNVKQATGGSQQPWLASSPIAGNFYFFNGPVTIVAPGATLAISPPSPAPAPAAPAARTPTVPPSAAGNARFDGHWAVELDCPTKGTILGFTYHFTADITNGELHGKYGDEGQPSSLSLDGTLGVDGAATFAVSGLSGRTEFNAGHAPPGKPYTYGVKAQFDPQHGTGERLGARHCDFVFTRR